MLSEQNVSNSNGDYNIKIFFNWQHGAWRKINDKYRKKLVHCGGLIQDLVVTLLFPGLGILGKLNDMSFIFIICNMEMPTSFTVVILIIKLYIFLNVKQHKVYNDNGSNLNKKTLFGSV